MATKIAVPFRSRLRPSNILFHPSISTVRRGFVTLPGTEPQTLSATRILPYKSSSLHALIADVNNYSNFVPYCIGSEVTKWSSPDKNGKRWPSEADLKVGWGGYEETFTSKLYCVPGSIVEALSGEATTSLPKSDISHYPTTSNAATTNSVFTSLSTRWHVVPFLYTPPAGKLDSGSTGDAQDRTEVHLTIEFQFSNPIYAALSKAVAPKVAGVMIEAFEAQARKQLGSSQS